MLATTSMEAASALAYEKSGKGVMRREQRSAVGKLEVFTQNGQYSFT
jgi:hypothetical protein